MLNNYEIYQTAKQLSNLLQDTDFDKIVITKGNIKSVDKNGGVDGIFFTDTEDSIIEKLLRDVGINPDMCLECMTDDNMKNSEFFIHLMRAYIHFLMLRYGPSMPISRDMAHYFLKHELLDDYVIYNVEHMKIMSKGDLNRGGFYDNNSFMLTNEK